MVRSHQKYSILQWLFMIEAINEVIIIGGGKSVSRGLETGLKDRIRNKCVIALNYSFRYFDHSFLCFGDEKFYKDTEPNSPYPNIYEELGKLPLIIGMNQGNVKKIIHPNTILFPTNNAYDRENSLKNGFYCSFLVGLFALSIAIYLMEGKGICYLLGFDWSRRNNDQKNNREKIDIHYYDISHRGTKWTNSYESHDPNYYFKPFESEKGIKIYNVNPNSNIENFKKIDYTEMYSLLSNQIFEQEELREEIKIKLLNY